jgi:hypothetical protein
MMTINDPATLAEVEAAFAAYEAALMANDVNALDALFWESPQTLRYGVGENLYGYDAIAQFRKERPGGSPQRVLTRTVITTFGTDLATANTEFLRHGAGRIGRQSQTWVRTDAGWKVASAHVSMMGDSH